MNIPSAVVRQSTYKNGLGTFCMVRNALLASLQFKVLFSVLSSIFDFICKASVDECQLGHV